MNQKELEHIKQLIQDKIDIYVRNTDIEFKIRYLMIQELEDLTADIEMFYKLNLIRAKV